MHITSNFMNENLNKMEYKDRQSCANIYYI